MSKTYLSGRAAALSPEGHFIAQSAFILLLWLGGGCVLFAQDNGVTVSNLAVSVGSPSTVTFNVSWSNTGMPTLWSDTVWVFVDYNQNGKMERLPVISATASAGTITKVPSNDKGVWIAGKARSEGSFSATIKLLTTISDVTGACAYASNYPPVGKYNGDGTGISFTGTPMYEILLAKADGGSVTVMSGDTLLLPCDYTVTSFTDATGAPGIMNGGCTAPGFTVDFTAFNPCEGAATGTVWYLTDTREAASTNTEARARTYKVKKMADDRIWMVQDLKFGDKCNKTDFTGSNGKDQTGNITTLTGTYYGDCTNVKSASGTLASRGYLYDWAAAMNKSGAYYGSTATVGCSGTSSGTVYPNPASCQGICPNGWHVPTKEEYETANTIFKSSYGCTNCFVPGSEWDGTNYSEGRCNGAAPVDLTTYYTSTSTSTCDACRMYTGPTSTFMRCNNCANNGNYKCTPYTLRCIRNY